jgi:hypothetical protein
MTSEAQRVVLAAIVVDQPDKEAFCPKVAVKVVPVPPEEIELGAAPDAIRLAILTESRSTVAELDTAVPSAASGRITKPVKVVAKGISVQVKEDPVIGTPPPSNGKRIPILPFPPLPPTAVHVFVVKHW